MSRLSIVLLLSCAAAAVSIYAWFQHDLAKARGRAASLSQVIETASGPMEFARFGSGAPLLVVHGAAGGWDQSFIMAQGLGASHYSVIAPSRFGYLRSPMVPGLTPAMQADAYAALLDRLGIGKVAVAAISAGAWSALEFAARHPDRCRALVLLVPAQERPPGMHNHGGAIARAMLSSDFAAWALLKLRPALGGALDRIVLGTDAAVIQAASSGERDRVRIILEGLLPLSARFDGMEFDIETAASPRPLALDQIRCPVLAISAQDDAFGTAERARQIATGVKDGRVVVYPTGGHALAGRYLDAVERIDAFLTQTGASAE